MLVCSCACGEFGDVCERGRVVPGPWPLWRTPPALVVLRRSFVVVTVWFFSSSVSNALQPEANPRGKAVIKIRPESIQEVHGGFEVKRKKKKIH